MPWFRVEVLVASQAVVVIPEFPTCAPPLVKAPCTEISTSLVPPAIPEVLRMNWKRVSLIKWVFRIAVSVAWIVFSEPVEL